jgi:hypothetical protein
MVLVGDFPRAGPAETGPEAGTIRLVSGYQ